MLLKIILLLSLVPLLELLVLLRISELTSFTFTVLLVIATGITGGILAKMEGLRVLGRIQSQLNHARLPANSLIDGTLILISGALLLTPGVITDAIGFVLLVPPSRQALREYLKRKFRKRVASGKMGFHYRRGFGPIHHTPPPGSPPMEDEVDDNDEEKRDESKG